MLKLVFAEWGYFPKTVSSRRIRAYIPVLRVRAAPGHSRRFI